VIVEKKSGMNKEEILKDPNVKEIDLAAISEKEIFVRTANIVYFISLLILYRMTLRRVSITANQQLE
jgi:hypothetical protein